MDGSCVFLKHGSWKEFVLPCWQGFVINNPTESDWKLYPQARERLRLGAFDIPLNCGLNLDILYIWIYSAYFTTLTECSCHTTMSLWFGHCILLHNNKYCYVDVLSEWSGIIRTYVHIRIQYINIYTFVHMSRHLQHVLAADVVLETNLL